MGWDDDGYSTRYPWDTNYGIVHPNAPRGSGGHGFFTEAGPLSQNLKDALEHPTSPNGVRLNSIFVRNWLEIQGGGKLLQMQIQGLVKIFADELVGEPVVGDGECYALLDRVLTSATAKSAPHFGIITPNADYVWGTEIPLNNVQPGDVLQFRNFIITMRTDVIKIKKYTDGRTGDDKSFTEQKLIRPHHSAIISAVGQGGKLTIVEQHLHDKDAKPPRLFPDIRKNTIDTKTVPTKSTKTSSKGRDAVGDFTEEVETKVLLKVEGKIWAYRVQPDNGEPTFRERQRGVRRGGGGAKPKKRR